MMLAHAKSGASWRVDGSDVAYYNAHARTYAANTFEIDLTAIRDRFLKHMRQGGLILDVGSGSGRDTLAFLRLGFRVEAIEPSAALAELSYELTGVLPRKIRVQDLADEVRFDGVWACASLVHVPPDELLGAIACLVRAAKPSAPVYLSFKHGRGVRAAPDGRPYSDLTEVDLEALLRQLPEAALVDQWRSEGPEDGRGRREVWLNAILLRR